jgi:hypothetical protein
METSSRFLREKHLIAPVRIKIAHQGHGLSPDVFESISAPETTDPYLKQRPSPVNPILGSGRSNNTLSFANLQSTLASGTLTLTAAHQTMTWAGHTDRLAESPFHLNKKPVPG